MSKTWLTVLWVFNITLAVLLFGLNLYFGDLNQDEGWYLYAAGQVRSGKMLYRDFAYTQAPVMPHVYALVYPLVQRGGVAAGRAFTAAIGLLSVIGASLLAARLAGTKKGVAAVLCFGLALVNAYQTYYFAVVKTYSLCSLFLVSGLLALSFVGENKRGWLPFLSGLCFLLAAGTRISFGITLPLVFLFLVLNREKFGRLSWFWFGFGSFVGLTLVFGPFLTGAFENFRFFAVQYHASRRVDDLIPLLVYKAGFVSRLVQSYFVASGVLLGVIVGFFMKGGATGRSWISSVKSDRLSAMQLLGWLLVGAVSLVHFCAPFPYDDYQAPVYIVFAALLAASVTGMLSSNNRLLCGVTISVLLLCAAAAFSSPVNQDWFISGRDRIWWRLKDEPAIVKLRKTARFIIESAGDNDVLLTQDPYLAVETGMKLPSGLEMGQFSYFPDLTSEAAEKLNVLNKPLFIKLLETTDASVAALSGYSFAIESPRITPVPDEDERLFWEIVESRYRLTREVSHFGQAHTTLKIFLQPVEGDRVSVSE